MRWLLLKDLQILRRSPLLVALLVLYPVIVALLVGFSFSRGPERPTVAVANELPEGEKLRIGGREVDLLDARREVFRHVDVIEAGSREEALDKVRDGEALGALVIPRDTIDRLETQLQRPRLRVYVNQEDPLKARLVDDALSSLVADANRRLSRTLTKVSLSYLGLILRGGSVSFLGREFRVLGLENVERIVRAAQRELPSGSRERRQLAEVVRFAQLSQRGLDLTDDVLAAVGEPISVRKTVLSGSTLPLTTFAAAVAVALSVAFLAVLLAAGSLALERSENVFERIVRGPLTRGRLLAEKILLAVGCSAVVTLVMLLGLGLFIPLEWERAALWIVALLAAAAAFAALGTAIGAVAREVSVASLLAFSLLLPVVFLALVPSGVVSEALYDLARGISALFPFRPTVKAMSAALYREGDLAAPLLHLGALTVAFAAAARLALRRFTYP